MQKQSQLQNTQQLAIQSHKAAKIIEHELDRLKSHEASGDARACLDSKTMG